MFFLFAGFLDVGGSARVLVGERGANVTERLGGEGSRMATVRVVFCGCGDDEVRLLVGSRV